MRHAQGATPEADGATPIAGTDEAFPVEDQLMFHEIVSTRLAETATPGALVGVWYPGRGTWLHAAGIGDLETAMPVGLDDHVRIASITKTFVATVVLQLVEEGQLSLDDALEAWVPGIPNGTEITIRNVLAMDAGIYDFVLEPVVSVDYDADPLLPFTPEDALAIIRESTPDFAPGERVHYSNSNYVLLGLIIEQITGNEAGTEIERRILQPLGMANTSFPSTPEIPEPFMRGYGEGRPGDPLRDVTASNPDLPWTSGAMISTLADMGTWAWALSTGALLSPEMQAERLTWGALATEPVSVSYGLGVLEIAGLVGHNGGILGYSSWMIHAPEEDATVVVVTNRAGTNGGTSDAIFNDLIVYLFPDRFSPSS